MNLNYQNIEFTDETIQKLFGYEAAEDEDIDRLKEYYFKNDIFGRVTSDLPLRVLVGHKGIGKSALFKVAMDEDLEKKRLPILIKPDDIADLGKNSNDFLQIIRDWKRGLQEIISKKVLNSLGIQNDANSLSKLTSYGGKIVSFLTETIKGIDRELDLDDLKKSLVLNFLKNGRINVYIDDLDRGWVSKKEDIYRISALLNSVRDISNDNKGLNFKLSLRSDVYYLVRTSDESTDKIENSVIWYSWENQEILLMLIKRIETFYGHEFDINKFRELRSFNPSVYLGNVFETNFTGAGKWQNAPISKVLMSMIRKRPRDLIKLCTLSAREAYQKRKNIIGTENLRAIFEEYSQGRIQDTINEYKSELPQIERLILGMKPSKRTIKAEDSFVYSTQELFLKINKVIEQGKFSFAHGSIAHAKDLAHFLYKINFLTARKVLETGEIDRKYFEENRYLSNNFVDFGYDWEVHPAYRWALQPDRIGDIFNKLDL